MRHRKKRWIFLPFMILAAVALLGLVVMLLWNNILPSVTTLKPLSYGQAVGILILCKILFGSFRPGSRGFRREGSSSWRNKLMNMSEEERARFKAEWRARRTGTKPPPSENR